MDRSKMYFWDVLALFVLVLIVFFVYGIFAISNWKDSFTPARTITVSAQGTTTATPDEAEISFSVVSQGANPQTLSTNNNTKMAAVLQFISSQGIASSDIATTNYDLEPQYSNTAYYPELPGGVTSQPPTIVGYTLTQTLEVKIRNLSDVATVLGGLAPLGVNQVGSVNFTFQNPNEFVAIARGQALSNAETEAGGLAAQAGATLGEVITVNESPNVPEPFPAYAESGAGGNALSAAVAPSLNPGTQDITDQVTVTYQLK